MAARIPPGTRRQTGLLNALIARVIGLGAGTQGPPALFTTLGRHRRLFRPWLRFASGLMPRGELPRPDAELVILRVAVLCDSAYEWTQHARIAPRVGLDEAALVRRQIDPAHVAVGRAFAELARQSAERRRTFRQLDEVG